MKTHFTPFPKLTLVFCLLLLSILSVCPALAQWAIGDRAEVNGEVGTVTKFGPPIFGGGNQIFVHLDRFGNAFPKTVQVDWKNKPGVKKVGSADDQWFTKSGDYWFYKDQGGYWVSEDENVQLGPTQ